MPFLGMGREIQAPARLLNACFIVLPVNITASMQIGL
jgi:hypothetical protein